MRVALASGGSIVEEQLWRELAPRGPVIERLLGRSDTLLVTVLYRGTGNEKMVHVRSNATRVLVPDNADGQLERIGTSRIWFLTMPAPADLLTTYSIQVTDTTDARRLLPDPTNPDSLWTSSGRRVSVLRAPAAAGDAWLARATAQPSAWQSDTLRVRGEGGPKREVWIHRPREYDPALSTPYPVVIALNRFNFRYAIPAPAVVDGLAAAGMIPPVILVVVDELDPDSTGYSATAHWLADELLPWLRSRYHASPRAHDIVLAGASRRGLVAAHVGLLRPDAIANVVSLSGAFYWRPAPTGRLEWLAAQYADSSAVPVRFYLAVGTLETVITQDNAGHYPLATSRHFADVLNARGYEYRLEEFAGTHDELNWRVWFGRGLAHLLADHRRAR